MSEHAFLPPSGADKWVHCSMWPTMVQEFPEEESEADREGTAAHWVAFMLVQTGTMMPVGVMAPNGVSVTEEMQDGARIWAHAVGELSGRTIYAERKITGKSIHPTHNYGTPDLWYFEDQRIHLFDYKFGFGIVEVHENEQAINYLSLIMDEMGINNGTHDQLVGARVTIVQPRGYHPDGVIRTWNIPKLSDLRADFNIMRAAAERATGEKKLPIVGPHCKHCPGRHACRSLQANVLTAIDLVGKPVPLTLPPVALGHELRATRRLIKLAEARFTGLEAQARSLLMKGERVPFAAMEESKPREQWTIPIESVIATGQACGVNIAKKEAMTPAQARAAGVPEEVVNSISTRPRGELRIVEDDGSKLRKLFGK